jgi:hypothetical protein
MLRNTRKRLHEFFRPKNALLQFYLQADHKITEGSERAARISHIRTASARCISPARAGPYEKGPKPASSFRRSTAPTRNSMRVSREGYISSQAYADKFTNAEIRPAGPKTPDFNTKPYQPNMSGSAQAPAPSCSRFSTIAEATRAARSTFGWPFLAVPAQQSFHQVRRGLGAEVFTGKRSHRRA